MPSLDEVTQQILAFRDKRDWKKFHSPRNLATALAIEAAELQQALLWKTDHEVASFLNRSEGRIEIRKEAADVLIFALLFCHEAGIDPIDAIQRKLRENNRKYPVRLAKGKATKYTKLRRKR